MSLVGCIITKLRHESYTKTAVQCLNGHEMNSESVNAMRNETFLSRCLPPMSFTVYFWRPGKALYFLSTLSKPSMPAFKVSSCEHSKSVHIKHEQPPLSMNIP